MLRGSFCLRYYHKNCILVGCCVSVTTMYDIKKKGGINVILTDLNLESSLWIN